MASSRGLKARFLLGHDYHLGDLLWFTAVLRQYREIRQPESVVVFVPDRDISRILENNPFIDEIIYGETNAALRAGSDQFDDSISHDLRGISVAKVMLRDWRHHFPPLYYRDLWTKPRGQWLATLLHLGQLDDCRPVLRLEDRDRWARSDLTLSERDLEMPHQSISFNGSSGTESRMEYVVLAPRIGSYRIPGGGAFWGRVKGWENEKWSALARLLGRAGYDTVTLAAAGQEPVAGTRPVLGLPIRQAAGVVEGAAAVVTGESGLWFVAAALGTPFVIVPWWLPRSIDWAGPMGVPHRLIHDRRLDAESVFGAVSDLISMDKTVAQRAGKEARAGWSI